MRTAEPAETPDYSALPDTNVDTGGEFGVRAANRETRVSREVCLSIFR
jgi:hypothetical protein